MQLPDDKSDRPDRLTAAEVEVALMMARTEPRAVMSCSFTVLYRVFKSGDWTQDASLRALLRHVMAINVAAGIDEYMTDEEARLWSNMVATVEGGRK